MKKNILLVILIFVSICAKSQTINHINIKYWYFDVFTPVTISIEKFDKMKFDFIRYKNICEQDSVLMFVQEINKLKLIAPCLLLPSKSQYVAVKFISLR